MIRGPEGMQVLRLGHEGTQTLDLYSASSNLVSKLSEELLMFIVSWFSFKEIHRYAVTCKYGLYLCQEKMQKNKKLAFIIRNLPIFCLFHKLRDYTVYVLKYPFTHLPVGFRRNIWGHPPQRGPPAEAPIITEAMWFDSEQYFLDEGNENTKVLQQILEDTKFRREDNRLVEMLASDYFVGQRDPNLYQRILEEAHKTDTYNDFELIERGHTQWLQLSDDEYERRLYLHSSGRYIANYDPEILKYPNEEEDPYVNFLCLAGFWQIESIEVPMDLKLDFKFRTRVCTRRPKKKRKLCVVTRRGRRRDYLKKQIGTLGCMS